MYHRECLIAWLNVKLECPQCRTPIPKPLEYDEAAESLLSDNDEEIHNSEAEVNRLRDAADITRPA